MVARRALLILFVVSACVTPPAERKVSPPAGGEIATPGARGAILDRHGVPLAVDRDGARVHPLGTVAASLLGGVGEGIGRSGIELSFDSVLRGRSHPRDAELDAAPIAQPVTGDAVVLTLDERLMRIADAAFPSDHQGAIVVVDVEGGAVRAMLSFPAPGSGTPAGESPLPNLAFERTEAPAGTMKTLTVLAGLEAGISPTERIPCHGFVGRGAAVWHDGHVHGEVDAREAIVTSCEVYALTMSDRIGFAGVAAIARDFGLGARTGIGIGDEAAGEVPSEGEAAYAAVGQSIAATPLQFALAYAAIANGGTLWRPRVVERVVSADGTAVDEMQPRTHHRVAASAEHLAEIRTALQAAGSQYTDGLDGEVEIAGKTGHGCCHEEGEQRYTAQWFVGYAPADRPQLAIAVVMYPSGLPAEIAFRILDRYFAPN